MSKLYISNLPSNYTNESLTRIFCPFGKILSIRFVRREERVSAFVEFDPQTEIESVITALNGRILHGADVPLVVQRAADRNRRLFIGNLPVDTDKKVLASFLGRYGVVEDVRIEQGKRYAFVVFERDEDARACIEALDGKITFPGSNSPMAVRIVESEQEKKAREYNKPSSEHCVYVYNLPDDFGTPELEELFISYGAIHSARVVEGRKGYVNYFKGLSALKAVKYLDGRRIRNKKINVILKKEKK
ncbi:Polyadenylate-binding protein 1-B [Astathelohania contejeani]|uniref:Polyadenylate-binding protein 1-B n=1 Tax=Astathelohania contejeani TaxID=164912 RepID=A0ABQ7HZJ9_9MICR|nr:Polyadenylate-binding protein 1-B [Thelohania contejeani]